MSDYPTIEQARSLGLFHPNCGHRYYRYIPGVTELPTAPTDGNLKDEVGYKNIQRQRHIERTLRKWKRRQVVAIDPAEQRLAKEKVREWHQLLDEHTTKYNIPRKRSREGVGKTRYGNNPVSQGGTNKFIAGHAIGAYERYAEIKLSKRAKETFLERFLPQFGTVSDYTIIRKEVFSKLNVNGIIGESNKKVVDHFEKHFSEYRFNTVQEYYNRYTGIMDAPLKENNIEGFTSTLGWTFRYDVNNNDLAIRHSSGEFSTLYKPSEGIEAWREQIEKYGPK